MELFVKFWMIYFVRSGISFPGFCLVAMANSVKCQIATLTDNKESYRNLPTMKHEHLQLSKLLLLNTSALVSEQAL
jgi:hypothetical protein